MFGQSFFLKKIAQKTVQGICEAFDMDEEDAKDFAKGTAVIVGVGGAILSLDLVGGLASVGEEIVEEVIEEETDEIVTNQAAPQFGGYTLDNWSSTNNDVVFDRTFDDNNIDQYGNHISEVIDQSVSTVTLDS